MFCFRLRNIKVFLLFLSPLACTFFQKTPEESVLRKEKYSFYIDAGSSGARIGVYSIEEKGSNSHVLSKGDFSTSDGLGIHNFIDNLEGIASYLDPLINYAEKLVDSQNSYSIPVYFYATGGLRGLPLSDQNRILKEVEKYLRTRRHFKNVHAKILTGEEEGAFAWLAVNSTRENFSSSSFESVGVVDLGGATLQITYEIKDEISTGVSPTLQFKIGDKVHKLYSHSYNFLGQNIFLKSNISIRESCREDAYTDLNTRYDKCFTNVQKLLQGHCKEWGLCRNKNLQNLSSYKFLGVGGIVYLSQELGQRSFTHNFLTQRAREICKLNEKDASKIYTGGFLDDLGAFCFRLVFFDSLFFGDAQIPRKWEGLGFGKNSVIEVTEELQGIRSITWLVGAVYFNENVREYTLM